MGLLSYECCQLWGMIACNNANNRVTLQEWILEIKPHFWMVLDVLPLVDVPEYSTTGVRNMIDRLIGGFVHVLIKMSTVVARVHWSIPPSRHLYGFQEHNCSDQSTMLHALLYDRAMQFDKTWDSYEALESRLVPLSRSSGEWGKCWVGEVFQCQLLVKLMNSSVLVVPVHYIPVIVGYIFLLSFKIPVVRSRGIPRSMKANQNGFMATG